MLKLIKAFEEKRGVIFERSYFTPLVLQNSVSGIADYKLLALRVSSYRYVSHQRQDNKTDSWPIECLQLILRLPQETSRWARLVTTTLSK